MKKFLRGFLVLSLFFSFLINSANAIKITIENPNQTIKIVNGQIIENLKNEEVFTYFSKFFEDNTAETYKYISLNFKGIDNKPDFKKALQILVYNDKIKNIKVNMLPEKTMKAYYFYKLANLILGTNIDNVNKDDLLSRNVASNDLDLVKNSYYLLKQKAKEEKKSDIEKNRLFQDVYKTILNNHYNKKDIKEKDLIYSAIEGLAKGTKDKYTVYFPPVKNKNFMQNLTGDFEGIGAYVELKEPGNFIIVSPISGSPAEKVGLKGGDRVIIADGHKITKENSSDEIISWIKGKAGTKVKLTILRGDKEIEFEVTRAKIHITNIDFEEKDNGVYYVKIKNFGAGVTEEFAKILKDINEKSGVKKIVFDLRNNGGGYLDEVTNMLSYIVPKGENTAVIKYHGSQKEYVSKGYNYLDLNKYKVVVLQNSGTASASEIMIGTLKDYFPNIKIIGEKSYGKGSVQTIKSYTDGSSFKYTVAKWFTGKTETGIDGTGIKPDLKLELDIEKFKKDKTDNQLEKALSE